MAEMQRGTKLESKKGIEFIIKGKYPSGQLNYAEDHYDVICPIGNFRLTGSLLEYLFEDVTMKEKEADEARLKEIKAEEEAKKKAEAEAKKAQALAKEAAAKAKKEADEAIAAKKAKESADLAAKKAMAKVNSVLKKK